MPESVGFINFDRSLLVNRLIFAYLTVGLVLVDVSTTAAASTETIASNLGPNDTYNYQLVSAVNRFQSVLYRNDLAARFHVGASDYILDKTSLAIDRQTAQGPLPTLLITRDLGGAPGDVIASKVLNPLDVVPNPLALRPVPDFDWSADHILLRQGESYWLVLMQPVASDLSEVYWYLNSTGVRGNTSSRFENNATPNPDVWFSSDFDVTPAFRVTGVPVPEPTNAIFALLLSWGAASSIRYPKRAR